MFIQHYFTGAVDFPTALKAVQDGEGMIFPAVVLESKKKVEGQALVYGFFFKRNDDTIWDITQVKSIGLKTLHSQDKVIDLLKEVYPEALGFQIPDLDERNLITRKSKRKLWIPRPIFREDIEAEKKGPA